MVKGSVQGWVEMKIWRSHTHRDVTAEAQQTMTKFPQGTCRGKRKEGPGWISGNE